MDARIQLSICLNGNCFPVGYGIYRGNPSFQTTVNFITLYDSVNLVAEGGVDVRDEKDTTIVAEEDGVLLRTCV